MEEELELEVPLEEAASQQPTPPKITKTRSRLHKRLEEIEHEITKFTHLPIDTPSASLDFHAQHINKKFMFIRRLLHAEIKSSGAKPHDLSEIEEKVAELNAKLKFYLSNLHPENVDGKSESGSGSGSDSDEDDDSVSEAGSDIPEKLQEVVVRPPKVLYESKMPCSDVEKVEMGGGGGRRWWRTVAVFTTVISAGLMVSFCNYVVISNRDEKFLTPT